MKKTCKIIIILVLCTICITYGIKLYNYYSPAKERPIYHTSQHYDDTIRIAYIGDSWAFGHQYHECKIANMLSNCLSKPVIVSSYGICGLTSKEIYYALFETEEFKQFIEKGYDYCFISAGINDTYKKMSTTYYQESMDYIIKFLISNNIHPIIQEIPDYNIFRAYERQDKIHKIIRQISMLVNRTDLDCKQQFRNALNEMIKQKSYFDKVSVVRYKSWNNDYDQDLKNIYLDDQMHLNEKGYTLIDSMIIRKVCCSSHNSIHYKGTSLSLSK